MKTILSTCAAALTLLGASTAIAGSPVVVAAEPVLAYAPVAAPSVIGEFSLWGQGVIPTNGHDGGNYCDTGAHEFCDNALGFGSYAGVQIALNSGWLMIGDLTFDYHGETDSGTSIDEPAVYGALGVHFVNDNGAMPWGVFGLLAAGHSLEEDDPFGPTAGIGFEMRKGNHFGQIGALTGLWDDADEVVDSLFFIRGGGEYAFGSGVLNASAAIGGGDFDGFNSNNDQGTWAQLAVGYEAGLTENINWFAGYQADYVHVQRTVGGWDQALFHTLKLGITIPIGGGDMTFNTPNFRAPLVSADEMN